MKRNIFVILVLALVCVLFVACGKEETPVDMAIDELQAARENIDNQITALEAKKTATKGGGTAVNVAVVGQPTPVEKTRDQMTEKEKEAYDKAIIERLNAVKLCDRFSVFYDAVKSGELVTAYYHTSKDLVVYYPALEGIPDNERKYAARPNYVAHMILKRCGLEEDYDADPLSNYLSDHPDELIEIVHAWKEQGDDAMIQAGNELLKKV